jgi:RNA polymerase sigma factor for flagellar operon FliA
MIDALWQRYRTGHDLNARRELLNAYLGLVHHCAHEMVTRLSRDIELDDLVGAGTVGLVQALEGFDPERGLAFSTYAMPRVRGAMLDELRGRDWRPRSVRGRSRRLAQARAEAEQRLGRAPSAQEVAESLGLDIETYWKWVDETEGRVVVALEGGAWNEEGGRGRLAETVPDPAATAPAARLAEEQRLDALRRAFSGLPQRERLVLALSFYEEMNLKQIGEVLHVTESRVSQIRTRALKRLREMLDDEEEEVAA